jgi:hypothetical protein
MYVTSILDYRSIDFQEWVYRLSDGDFSQSVLSFNLSSLNRSTDDPVLLILTQSLGILGIRILLQR